jgi:hypothetical protein
MQTEQGKIPPPPGLIASLASGFDAVATHILVIALPVFLDLFLWLGPHLRLDRLLQPFIARLPALLSPALLPSATAVPDVGTLQKGWSAFADQVNLFSILHTFPVGISSLMSLLMPVKNPLGAPLGVEVGSSASVAGWGLLLIFIGWLLGGLYYHWVSAVSLKLGPRPLGQSLKQIVFLSIIWLGFLFVIGIPAFVIYVIITLISPLVGQVVLFVFGLFAIWLLMPIFFSPHGIFTYQHDAFRAILNSLRMVRFTLPNTGLFLLTFVLVGQGLDFLWRTPPATSWLILVGIAGHAFVSTGLLAASFIYYRDINAWLQVIFEQLRAQATSARV